MYTDTNKRTDPTCFDSTAVPLELDDINEQYSEWIKELEIRQTRLKPLINWESEATDDILGLLKQETPVLLV